MGLRGGVPADEEEIKRPTKDGFRHFVDSVISQLRMELVDVLVRERSPSV